MKIFLELADNEPPGCRRVLCAETREKGPIRVLESVLIVIWRHADGYGLLNLTGFYISIALRRAYATCHSERKEPLALSAAEGEESHTRNGTKSCSKARCFASLSVRSPSDSMTV